MVLVQLKITMALRVCASPTCPNTSRTTQNLIWFPLPKTGFLRDQWIDLLSIKDGTISENTRVCSSHFKPKDINKTYKQLRADALPCLHLGRRESFAPKTYEPSDIELSDDDVKVIEEKKKPIPTVTTPEGRPSRRAARMAAEKIQNTVRKYLEEEEEIDDPKPAPPPPPPKPVPTPEAVFTPATVMKSPFDLFGSPQKNIAQLTKPLLAPKGAVVRATTSQVIQLPMKKTQQTSIMQQISPKPNPKVITYSVKPNIQPGKTQLASLTSSVVIKPAMVIQKSSPQISIIPKPAAPVTPLQSKPDIMNLQMDCEDEGLSPYQVKSYQNAVKAQEEFERKMQSYKNAKDTRIIYCTTNEIPPISTASVLNPKATMPQGTNTVKSIEKSVLQASSQLLQPGMVLTHTPQGMQIIRGVTTPQTIVLGSTTNTVTGATTPLSYKVLVDSRTGLVVGTIPNDSPLIQASNNQTVTLQNKPLQVHSIANTSITNVTSTATISVATDNAYNKVIAGGNKTVVAQSLLSIKVHPFPIQQKDNRNNQITQLGQQLDKDKFLSIPILWLAKVGLIDKEIRCLCMKDTMSLSVCKLAVDGYVWRCKKAPRCQRVVQIPRVGFFARFGAPLYKLHRLIFHWSSQSDILHVIHDTNVDIYMVRSVYRAVQEICGKSMELKAKKLGGPGSTVEVATMKMGWHIIIGALDRGTGLSRMKVITENRGLNVGLSNIIQKPLESWLEPHTTVITTDYKLSTMSKNTITYKFVEPNRYNGDITVKYAVEHMENHLVRMFGSFSMVQLKPETIQGFLDEYQWRVRFGRTPKTSFWNIMSDIAQQSGRKLIMQNDPVTTISTSSSSSGDDSALDNWLDDTYQKLQKSGQLPKKMSAAKPMLAPSEPPKLVDLNNYYYARKSPNVILPPDPDRNTYKFKCLICRKILDNNIKVMKHLMAHLEQTRQKNPDLSDLTQCKYCFRDFETPYSMQCHMENVHLSTNDLACKICNTGLNNKTSLINHMKNHHVQSEVPYCCQTCHYRSSFHPEVIEHFQQSHNGTNKLLCHYCLKTYNVKFSQASSIGMIQNYYYHLYKHQIKSANKKCSNCCLVFVNIMELKSHRQKDHLSMAKKKDVVPLPMNTSNPILVSEPTKKPKAINNSPGSGPRFSKVIPSTSSSSPPVSEPWSKTFNENHPELSNSPVFVSNCDNGENICVECRQEVERNHYAKKMTCGKCRYSTYCGKGFVDHMIAQHSNVTKSRKEMYFVAEPIEMLDPLFCICGFSNTNCNILANHLKKCGSTTVYPTTVAAMANTVKKEPEDEFFDKGSAFFPPLVVLDENEEEFVNTTLSKIPEPTEKKEKPSLLGKRKISGGEFNSDTPMSTLSDTKEAQVEKPSMLNALGLVRRKSTHSSEDDGGSPPLLTREDIDGKSLPRKGPARNTRSSRSIKKPKTFDEAEYETSYNMDADDAPPELDIAQE